MSVYFTTQGDVWDMISFKLFGNEYFSDQLIAANPSQIYTNEFDAGVPLQIPSVLVPTSVSQTVWGGIVRYS